MVDLMFVCGQFAPRTPLASIETVQELVAAPQDHVRRDHVVPCLACAVMPVRVRVSTNMKLVGRGGSVATVNKPVEPSMASHAVAQLKAASRQVHPESHRADHPVAVVSTVTLNAASGP
jgi:hypothetical protein